MIGFGNSDWSYNPFEKMVIFPPDPLLELLQCCTDFRYRIRSSDDSLIQFSEICDCTYCHVLFRDYKGRPIVMMIASSILLYLLAY